MKLYNTLSRQIEDFTPINADNVKMYTCGLTVYSQPQIGNWVAYIYSDVLVRTLIASGFSITRTQNITDVGHLVSDADSGEDKMEKGARNEGITAWDVAEKYIEIANKEARLLDLLPATNLIRATDLVDEQIEFVKQLEAKGFTYIIDDGVYFDTSKLDDYGKLARLDIKGLQAGARVDVGSKKLPTDFAVWKLSPKGQKRDMEWDSPWGKGFPGWHLECSVIARQSLGDQIDIHTGGIDHIPVHHTNEIAQTEAVTDKKPFSKYWFHNNHMKVNGTKLAKSLGNSYTLNDITHKGFDLDAFKLLVLSSHYQTEGNFSWEILEAAQNRLQGLEKMADLKWQTIESSQSYDFKTAGHELLAAMQNNLDTPQALFLINETSNELEKHLVGANDLSNFQAYLEKVDSLLGLHLAKRQDISSGQKKLLEQRSVARDSKNWPESDRLRDELNKQNIYVRDTEHGQIWSRC